MRHISSRIFTDIAYFCDIRTIAVTVSWVNIERPQCETPIAFRRHRQADATLRRNINLSDNFDNLSVHWHYYTQSHGYFTIIH